MEPDATTSRAGADPGSAPARVGRRLHSAGSAIVVSLVGLALGVLLNAPGLHKSATIQPEGWKRDVALGVTGPLASSATRSSSTDRAARSRPRSAARTTTTSTPPSRHHNAEAAARQRRPPAPPKRTKFTPQHKLGSVHRGRLARHRPRRVPPPCDRREPRDRAVDPIDGRIATGLERPDVYNWFTRIERRDAEGQAARGRPHVRRQRRPRLHDRRPGGPRGRHLRKPELARRVPPARRDRDGHGDAKRRRTSCGSGCRSRATRSRRCGSTS